MTSAARKSPGLHSTGLFQGDSRVIGDGVLRKCGRFMFKAIIFQKSWCRRVNSATAVQLLSSVLHKTGVTASCCFKPGLAGLEGCIDGTS